MRIAGGRRVEPGDQQRGEQGYARFEARVIDRLDDHLTVGHELEAFIDALIERVLRDALELGPELQSMVREEMRPETLGAERQTQRLEQQVRMISRWWEDTVGTPPFEAAIHAIVLLLQAAELRVASSRDEADLERLKSAISFVIRATVDVYRMDSSAAGIPGTKY